MHSVTVLSLDLIPSLDEEKEGTPVRLVFFDGPEYRRDGKLAGRSLVSYRSFGCLSMMLSCSCTLDIQTIHLHEII